MQIKHKYKTEGGLEQNSERASFECVFATVKYTNRYIVI